MQLHAFRSVEKNLIPAWVYEAAKPLDAVSMEAARLRQSQLTKPPGSLGRLEEVAIRLAGMRGHAPAPLDPVRIVVFAADHGVAAERVSAFPQAVTVEMVRNFARGGAAISVLARATGATLEVVNVGTVADPGELPGVVDRRIAPGTANFAEAPAMSKEQLGRALAAGAEAVDRAQRDGARLLIGGEMGIANTTSAAAIACALLGLPATDVVGPGTGVDRNGVVHKASVVDAAIERHRVRMDSALAVLRCVGGFEIAALAGAYQRCAQLGIPALVDGFIASSAVLAAARWCPGITDWCIFAHSSAEPGHARILSALGAVPLLDLGMRLGEGSGAAAALPLVRLAAQLHFDMATFAEAGVSGATP